MIELEELSDKMNIDKNTVQEWAEDAAKEGKIKIFNVHNGTYELRKNPE